MDHHRKIVIIPSELFREIEDYRFDERKESFAEAFRDLARKGLQAHNSKQDAGSPIEPENQ